MNTQNIEVVGEQVSLFDLFSNSFPIPETGNQREKFKTRQAKTSHKKIENIQAELDLMLDVLVTPECIIDTPDTWSDEDIHHLRVFMLNRHLKFILDGRTAAKVQKETWDWIVDDSMHPFCFPLCVQALAVELGFVEDNQTMIDAQEVRLAFYFMAKRAGQQPHVTITP